MLAITLLGELLRFNGSHLNKLVSKLPPEAWYKKPHGMCNPLIWIFGHIIVNRGEILEILGGDPNTKSLADHFARGTIPQSDSSNYPQPQQLINRLNQMVMLTDQLIKGCDSKLMSRPSWGQFSSVGQNLAYSYMHETHHIGQISYLLGMPEIKSIKRQTTKFSRPEVDKKGTTGKILLDGIKSMFA